VTHLPQPSAAAAGRHACVWEAERDGSRGASSLRMPARKQGSDAAGVKGSGATGKLEEQREGKARGRKAQGVARAVPACTCSRHRRECPDTRVHPDVRALALPF
jgi:hypothetical protein